MSLLPLILQDDLDDMWNWTLNCPTHRFGLGLNGADYYRPFGLALRGDKNRQSGQVAKADGPFKVNLNVQDFAPNEITITTNDNVITVEGKHEEKSDGDGLIWRHFIRKYLVPEGHNLENAVSSLSSNGILTIAAPKKGEEKKGPVTIPITRAGEEQKQNEVQKK